MRGQCAIKPQRLLQVAAIGCVAVVAFLPLPAAAFELPSLLDLIRGGSHPVSAAPEASFNSQNMRLLQAARNIDPNPSRGGGEVLIVEDALLAESGPVGTAADLGEHHAGSDQISIYVVREGDTLSQIAEMFKVSVNTIRWANDIGGGKAIQPGDTLVILPISGIRHTVKTGDTLASIVKKYGGDMDEVLNYNGLAEGAPLALGEVVVVPNGEIAAPKASGTSGGVKGGGPALSGYFIRPVSGVRTQGLHGYNGVDLGAPAGTQVVASAAGEVIVSLNAGWNGGYGNYVVIRHENGTQTLYAHLNQSIVSAGSEVVQGQVIGYVGSTGRSTGSHLHFEVRGAKNPF